MDENIIKKMFDTFISPEIQGCLAAIESIAGYNLPASERQSFLYFHEYVCVQKPAFIQDWLSDPNLEKWHHSLVNGFLGNVQNALACVLYHHGRLLSIERAVLENIEKYDYRKALGNSTVALGNTLTWDFEYQAFVLACRRCLDYLARAICSYFKSDFHSFRKLGNFLKHAKPARVSLSLIPTLEKYCPKFDFILSDSSRKSLRDKISHYEYIGVGTINLSQRGFVLAGGGENLNISQLSGTISLSELLDSRANDLKACVCEMIYKFVDSLKAEHGAPT